MNQNDQIADAFNYFFCNIGHNLDKNLMISYQMLNSLCQMVLLKYQKCLDFVTKQISGMSTAKATEG
jgi:hypothetical protein